MFVKEAGGLRFKSQAGKIGNTVANGSLLLQHFFERSCFVCKRNDAEMGQPNWLRDYT